MVVEQAYRVNSLGTFIGRIWGTKFKLERAEIGYCTGNPGISSDAVHGAPTWVQRLES